MKRRGEGGCLHRAGALASATGCSSLHDHGQLPDGEDGLHFQASSQAPRATPRWVRRCLLSSERNHHGSQSVVTFVTIIAGPPSSTSPPSSSQRAFSPIYVSQTFTSCLQTPDPGCARKLPGEGPAVSRENDAAGPALKGGVSTARGTQGDVSEEKEAGQSVIRNNVGPGRLRRGGLCDQGPCGGEAAEAAPAG